MKKVININGKSLEIQTSDAADNALAKKSGILVAEMELLFSCLVAKRVRFLTDSRNSDDIQITDNLGIRFKATVTESCEIADSEDLEIKSYPVPHGERYIPHWLEIDYRAGQWIGEFGYSR
ncbi:MAG: hypothetical protein OEY67_04285 [Gammaproteobacteria bacterium]|nr:hypothetical protein [Gammaproteobacteria bacterium]